MLSSWSLCWVCILALLRDCSGDWLDGALNFLTSSDHLRGPLTAPYYSGIADVGAATIETAPFVVPLQRPRAMKGDHTLGRRLSQEGLPPYILRLRAVHLSSAQGRDRFHTYVSQIEVAIALSLGLQPTQVQGVALLVYRDRAASVGSLGSYGYLILLFVVDLSWCESNATACHNDVLEDWTEALSNSTSDINVRFTDQVDPTTPHYLTPALCDKWEIRGPGCNTDMSSRHYMEEPRGIPLLMYMGLGSMSILVCATYPLYRAIQARGRARGLAHQVRLPTPAMSVEALETQLREIPRESVSVDRLQEEETCPICLSRPVDDLSEPLLILPCRHCLHVACAQAWLVKHLQCPLCRRAFTISECTVWDLEESTARGDKSLSDGSDGGIQGDQHPAVASSRSLIVEDIRTELDESKKDTADLCHGASASAAEEAAGDDVDGEGKALAIPAPRNYTMSDPRSPIMRVSINGTLLGKPQLPTPDPHLQQSGHSQGENSRENSPQNQSSTDAVTIGIADL